MKRLIAVDMRAGDIEMALCGIGNEGSKDDRYGEEIRMSLSPAVHEKAVLAKRSGGLRPLRIRIKGGACLLRRAFDSSLGIDCRSCLQGYMGVSNVR